MEFDNGGGLWVVVFVALAPVVGQRVGKNVTRLVESSGCDDSSRVLKVFQTVLGFRVPVMEASVGACRAKGAIDGVVAHASEGIYKSLVSWGYHSLAVALERKAKVLVDGRVNVLDTASAFDGAYRVAVTVGVASNGTGLPFKWRRAGAENGTRVVQVDDANMAFGSSNNQ